MPDTQLSKNTPQPTRYIHNILFRSFFVKRIQAMATCILLRFLVSGNTIWHVFSCRVASPVFVSVPGLQEFMGVKPSGTGIKNAPLANVSVSSFHTNTCSVFSFFEQTAAKNKKLLHFGAEPVWSRICMFLDLPDSLIRALRGTVPIRIRILLSSSKSNKQTN